MLVKKCKNLLKIIFYKFVNIFKPTTSEFSKKIKNNNYDKFKKNGKYPPGIQGDGHILWIENSVKDFSNLLVQQCSPKIILDIGSLNGIESVFLADIFPEARIFAFEANPEAYKITKNITNEIENITLYNFAVSDVDKIGNFFVTPNMGTSSMLQPIGGPAGEEFKEISTKFIRIDTWAIKNKIQTIDAVWMDVQGAEEAVLSGFGSLLSGVKVLKTEIGKKAYYKNHSLKDSILPYLDGMNPFKINSESMWEDDIIFVRK